MKKLLIPICEFVELYGELQSKGVKVGSSMGDFPFMHTTQEKAKATVHLVESTKIAK